MGGVMGRCVISQLPSGVRGRVHLPQAMPIKFRFLLCFKHLNVAYRPNYLFKNVFCLEK